jgi:hypothetical protein
MSQCPCWAIWANNSNNDQIKADILRYNILLGNHVRVPFPISLTSAGKVLKILMGNFER